MFLKAHSQSFKSYVILCALLILTCVVFFSLSFSSNSSFTAFAAGAKVSSNASLDTGYLTPGTNILSTAAAQEDLTGGLWPSSGEETTGYNAQDFHVASGTSAIFTTDYLSFRGGKVGVLALVNGDTNSVSSALMKAMQDQNFIINISFEAQIQIGGSSGDDDVTVQTVISWYPSGTGGSVYSKFSSEPVIQPTGGSFQQKVTLGGDNIDSGFNPTDPNNVLYTSVPIVHNQACFLIEISDTNNPDVVPVLISSAKIQMDIEMVGLSINLDAYQLSVQGENRPSIVIPGIKNPETSGPETLADTFVKAGDQVTVKAQVMNSGLPYEFPDYYTALFFPIDDNFANRTCLDWHTYSYTYDENIASYLELVPLPVGATPEQITSRYSGYDISFQVKEGVGNSNQVKLLPRLPIQIVSGTINYFDFDISSIPEREIVVKVDDNGPSSPIIDATKGVGITIESREWYTVNRTIYLDYSSSLTSDFELYAEEKVYAYILHDSVSDFDLNLCDFSKLASDPANNYPFGDGVNYASMQDLGVYTNVTIGGGKLPLNIVSPGEYSLVLIAVDSAGNVSSPTIYHKGNLKSLKVDDTTRPVGFQLLYGSSEFVNNYANNVGNVYIYVGSRWHQKNIDGTYTFLGGDTQLSGDGVFQVRTRGVNRNQPITLMLLTTPTHYNTYRPVRYTNRPAMEGMFSDNPVYTEGRDNNRYYTITFTTNDEIWNSGQDSGMVLMYFNKRVDLGLISNDFSFIKNQNTGLGDVIGLDGYVEAYFPYNPINQFKTYPPTPPDIDLLYYNLEEYQVYAKTTIVNNVTVTTTGGYVVYKGIQYDMPENFDLVTGTRVGNTISISGESGAYNLSTLTRTDGAVGQGYKSFYVSGYIKENYFETGFVDAGRYVYKASVNLTGDSNLFGEKIDIFEIKKADPKIYGLHGQNTLYYNDSMDELVFASTYENGNPVAQASFTYGDKIYYMSSAGVFGYYEISSPSPGTIQYDRPNVSSNLLITVNFRPIDVVAGVDSTILFNNWNTVFYNYYNRTATEAGYVYTLIPGKSHSGNYKTQTIQISIEVRASRAYIEADAATTRTTFNQEPQGLQVKIYQDAEKTQLISSVPTIIQYRDKLNENSVFSSTMPTNAGVYQAKIDIDTTKSNYYNEDSLLQDFTIEKRKLGIFPIQPSGEIGDDGYYYEELETPVLFGQYEATSVFTFKYGYLDVPDYIFGEFIDELFVETTGLQVTHSFSKVKDANNNFLDPYGDWINQSITGILISDLLSAGTHLAEIKIDNQNYEGEIISLFVIEKGTAEGNLLSVNMPLFVRSYDAIGLDGTLQGKLGHIEFGQTLASKTTAMLQGADTRGTYKYRNKNGFVPGRFYFESEEEYYARNSNFENIYLDVFGNRILDVKYGTGASSNRIMAHTVTIYWQAGVKVLQSDGNGGSIEVFVPNENFSIMSFPAEIVVVRAKPNTSNLRLSNITYKQKLKESSFLGDILSNGFILSPNDQYTLRISVNPETVYPGGTHNVLSVFEPTSESQKHYLRVENISVPIIVEKRQILLSFPPEIDRPIVEGELNEEITDQNGIVYNYGLMYQHPTTIVKNQNDGVVISDAQLEYIYFKDLVAGYSLLPGESIMSGYEQYVRLAGNGINNSTSVGKYYVLVRAIGSNYVGEIFKDFYVIKSSLTAVMPSIPIIEYGAKLSDVVFPLVNAQNADSTKIISGRFTYENSEASPDVGDDYLYRIIFTPTSAFSLYLNFKPIYFDLGVIVQKRTIDISVTNLTHVYTGAQKQVTGSVENPEIPSQYLPLVYTYPTVGNLPPRDAGEYQVVVSISPSVSRYRGSKTVLMVISKALVYISSEDVEVEYNGMLQPFSPEYTIPEGTLDREFQINSQDGFKITYYNRQSAVMAQAPQYVGLYFVNVELITLNYRGQATINYYISPSLASINNLSQTFCPPSNNPDAPKVLPVTLSFKKVIVTWKDSYGVDQSEERAHQNVNYSVLYKSNEGLLNQDYIPNLDISGAGIYNVRIIYSENGYNKVIDGIELVVHKATLALDLLNYYSSEYTSSPIRLDGITLPGDIQGGIYYYRSYKPGEIIQDEFSSEVLPLNAGFYEVKIVLVDDNYQGEETTLFEIKKANLRIVNTPSANPVEFNSDKTSVTFVPGSGIVRFPATGATITDLGVWSIESDISFLIVGTGYPVVVRFTPNEVLIPNFNIAEMEMNITIIKRNIGSYILFDEESLVCSYSRSSRAASAYISAEAGIVPGYGRIQLIYYYNGIVANPTNVNTYDLVVRVDDKNYTGVSETKAFSIQRAVPVIVPPSIKQVNRGNTLDNTFIIPQTGNGINPNDSEVIVLGSFSFLNETQVMNLANYRLVKMNFQPNDPASYMNVIFDLEVYVVGESVNITSAVAQPSISNPNPTYGTMLSEFSLDIYINGVLATEQDGVAEWKEPSKIVSVLGTATYIFTPTNSEVYNIYEGVVVIDFLSVAEMDVIINDCDVKMFVGDSININNPTSSLIINLKVRNSDFPSLIVNPNIEVLEADNPGIDFNSLVALSEDAGKLLTQNGNVLNVTFRLKSANYLDTTVSLSIKVLHKVLNKDFLINNKTKKYDGLIVGINDFNIRISGTSRPIPLENLVITKITYKGLEVNEIKLPGSYLVNLEIKDSHYFGSYQFIYYISKNDISSYLTISNNLRIFGDNTAPTSASFGQFYQQAISETNSTIVFNYIDKDGVTSLGPLPPRDAGNYWVEISIDSDDKFFSAYKKFTYQISKKEAFIELNSSYTYSYGINFNINPLLSNSLSLKDYSVAYYVSGENVPLVSKPSNVGRYRVVFSISHKNYFGSSETTLVINKLRLQLNIAPIVESVEYGVKIGTVGFDGGEVVTNDSAATRVYGTFSFVDPNATPSRGIQSVQVRFNPYNENYEAITFALDITIVKRKANVNFISSNAIYNGLPQLPIIRTDPALNIGVRFTIYKDGLQVNSAINVGSYRIIASIADDNYEGSTVLEVYQITKAKAILSQSVMPTASPIEYNQALNKSTLLGGSMVYVNNGSPVAGTFKYINKDLMLGPVGTYNNISYHFIPVDLNNYEVYESTISVSVVKTNATLIATNTQFVYGEQIRRPLFISNPANLSVQNNEFELDINNIVDVGTYRYNAYISDTNYKGSVVYNITVIKKQVEVQFYLATVPVDTYRTTFGNIIYAKSKIKTTSLVPRDIQYVDEIEKNLQYYYGLSSSSSAFTSVTPPVSIGQYIVYAKMNHRNYELMESSSWITYQVARADVQRLEFDYTSLSTQIYGSVTMPTILVTPSNVSIKVSFPGYAAMPTTAGTHSIRVEVLDNNYNPSFRNGTFIILPKEISIENIIAYDKPVDGLSDIQVEGDLGGVLQGDEVFLKMKANTESNAVTVGTHAIVIKSWELNGLHASNYSVRPPVYRINVKITNKVVTDPSTDSYISSATGFNSNVTVSFKDVYDTVNKTNFLTSMIGQKATVQTISVKENGLNTVLDEKVKFYVKIPEAYLNSENLVVEGLGNLANQSITFTREGDYMTFYADTSGEIIFYNNDFPYWIIIVAAVIVMVIIGVVLLVVLMPKKKRKVINASTRKAYEFTQEAKELEVKAEVLSRIQEKEKKRRWRL